MKMVLEDLSDDEKQRYELKVSPLHPWAPVVDDRTGFAQCSICVYRKLAWSLSKGVHRNYEIREEIDFPWEIK